MKVTIKNGHDESSSELGISPIQICFNALRGIGMSDEAILKDMYSFSSQFIKTEETKSEETVLQALNK